MEPETLLVKQEDMEKSDSLVETSINEENIAEKLNENNVEIDVMSIVTSQPAVVVPVPFVPDLTLFSYEVQQGYRIVRELLSDQYKSIIYPFLQPVDVEGLNLWDYHARIETPMSFSQIESKFNSYVYESITAVISDVRLILENCYRYNGSAHWISKLAHKLEKVLDQKLALLNRSLREKVTLHATMTFRNKNEIVADIEEAASGGRPRRSGRTSYVVNGVNAEKRSSLMNHLLLEEEENQREMKRMKEKEKKEANEALMQKLSEWEDEIFTKNVLKELRSMWEIPSIGSFLWLFLPALNLPELNYTEFEHGFILPHKSQQMAWIFTSLLVTPSQRKSIHKKLPMKFEVWERKLKEHMDIWYLAKQDEELQMVARQIGLNPTFFQILGESNPLETKSYLDLTLHQRVLILKVLCDECLDYHPQLRDVLGNTDTIPYSETYLGYDGQNSTYLYFPIFDATDIRIYKQAELPALNEWYRKWTSNSKAFSSYKTPKRTSQSKSRRSSTSSKKSKGLGTTIEPGFQLVCSDVESLRGLCEKFAERPPTPSRKKSGGRPTRRRCEKDLHKVLSDLLEDLSKNDARYSRARVKGMINLMRDWKSDELDSGNEFNAQDDETADTCSESLHTPLENETTDIPDDTNIEEIPGEEGAAPLLSMVTRSRKRKFLDYDDITSASSSPLSEFSKNFEAFDDNPDLRIEIRAEKRPNLDNDVVQDSVTSGLCDVIVRAVVDDVIRAVVDDVICDVVDDAISKVSVSESDDVAINGVDNDGLIGTTVTRNGNEGHGDDKMGVNGVEIKDQTEDHLRVSMDDKEQQLMETDSKNDDSEGNRDTVMDIDGFKHRQNHATFVDNISNDSTLMTNGNGHKEQNVDTRNIELQQASHNNTEVCNSSNVNEQKSSVTYSGQNCHGSEEINSSISGIEGTIVYNNGQCSEVTNDVCNGSLSIDSFNSKTPSEKWSTRIVPTGKESTGIVPTVKEPTRIIPTVKESTRMFPTGIVPTVKVPTRMVPTVKEPTKVISAGTESTG